jgi:hypothetical protein
VIGLVLVYCLRQRNFAPVLPLFLGYILDVAGLAKSWYKGRTKAWALFGFTVLELPLYSYLTYEIAIARTDNAGHYFVLYIVIALVLFHSLSQLGEFAITRQTRISTSSSQQDALPPPTTQTPHNFPSTIQLQLRAQSKVDLEAINNRRKAKEKAKGHAKGEEAEGHAKGEEAEGHAKREEAEGHAKGEEAEGHAKANGEEHSEERSDFDWGC